MTSRGYFLFLFEVILAFCLARLFLKSAQKMLRGVGIRGGGVGYMSAGRRRWGDVLLAPKTLHIEKYFLGN